MIQNIAIKYCNGIVTPSLMPSSLDVGHSLSFISEMMAYGYIPSVELGEQLSLCTVDDITVLYNEVIPILKKSVGAHVKHKPFYPNFPTQVMTASNTALFLRAQAHYWTAGKWLPNFTIEDRPVGFEDVDFKVLDIVTDTDIDNVFTQILQSADSITESSKAVVEWFVTSGRTTNVPERIPFKENICLLAGIFIENNLWDSTLVQDTTDVLRIATFLSDGLLQRGWV